MILVDGQTAESVAATDRGLAYGDGVFRTLRSDGGRPVWWNDQYARLAADCAALGLVTPDETTLRREVCSVAGTDAGVVKIIVTRGAGARGYARPADGAGTRIVMSAPLPPHARPGAPRDVTARWCDLRLAKQPRLAGVKHLNRLENVLARAEWNDPAIFEGLLRDTDGAVIGGVMSNVFWIRDDTLFTPELGECGVAGATRMRLLRAAPGVGLAPRIGRWLPEAILAADEVMICNSVIGVRRVARLGDATWKPAGWTKKLNDALDDDPD